MQKIKKQLKRFMSWFYLRHSKLYTALILAIGIGLGCIYQGRGDLGELIFSCGNYTVYVGGFEHK